MEQGEREPGAEDEADEGEILSKAELPAAETVDADSVRHTISPKL